MIVILPPPFSASNMQLQEILTKATKHGCGEFTNVVVMTADGKEHKIKEVLTDSGVGTLSLRMTDEEIARLGQKNIVLLTE